MTAVFKREFKSYFTGPIGYVYLAVCFFFQSLSFITMYSLGYPYIQYLFSEGFFIVLFTTPLLTMRIMSEEKRQKTDQLLFTSPVSITGVIMGKFFAAFSVFMLSYSLTFIFQLILASNANVDWMIYISNIIGVALLGMALIGLGIFISSLTESQIVAAILSFAVAFLLMKLDDIVSMINVEFITKIFGSIYFLGRYSAFMEGVLDYSNMIFFVSFAAIFLFLSIRVLDRKRWA